MWKPHPVGEFWWEIFRRFLGDVETLPETNSKFAPENRGPLEKEIPIGNHNFQVLC